MDEFKLTLSTLYVIDQKRFQCGDCVNSFIGQPDEAERLKYLQEQKFCRAKPTRVIHPTKISDKEVNYMKCPGNFYNSVVAGLYMAYSAYEQGTMPYSGGYLDQPAKVIEIFSVIGNYKATKLKDERTKQRLEQARQGRLGGRR